VVFQRLGPALGGVHAAVSPPDAREPSLASALQAAASLASGLQMPPMQTALETGRSERNAHFRSPMTE